MACDPRTFEGQPKSGLAPATHAGDKRVQKSRVVVANGARRRWAVGLPGAAHRLIDWGAGRQPVRVPWALGGSAAPCGRCCRRGWTAWEDVPWWGCAAGADAVTWFERRDVRGIPSQCCLGRRALDGSYHAAEWRPWSPRFEAAACAHQVTWSVGDDANPLVASE